MGYQLIEKQVLYTGKKLRLEIHHLETVPLDPDVNFRGIGEGGMLVTPPALVNAVEDALSPFGVRITEQHLPPLRILELTANRGVDRIETEGEGLYHWLMAPRSTLGVKFRADYVVKYQNNGKDEISWTTVSGNTK